MSAGFDTGLVVGLGVAVAVGAAVRSTWSPCGLSMLSTITPFGERGRGHRYSGTAAWFIAGSTLGGATLGAAAVAFAAVVAATGLSAHPAWVVGVAAAAAVGGAAVDAGVFGDVIPLWRRQVDDGWLVRYRRWVYAGGFGWQIGVGVATYIMTAAVFLMVVLAGLTASPVAAFGICVGFGLLRGLAVLATATSATPDRLRDLHRGFHRAGPPVRVAVIVVEVLVAVGALAALWPLVGVGVGLIAAAAGAALAAGVRVEYGPIRTPRAATSGGACRTGISQTGVTMEAGEAVAARSVAAAGAGDR